MSESGEAIAVRTLGALLFVLSACGTAWANPQIFEFTGNEKGDQFGTSVAAAGDVNADGHRDIIVGATQQPLLKPATGPGYARVYSGSDGSVLLEFLGQGNQTGFGSDVGGGADLDGDGHDDVMVAANILILGLIPVGGSTRVYSGASGQEMYFFQGVGNTPSQGGTQHSIAMLGDVDLDGHPDVIMGAPSSSIDGIGSGAVYVYSGATGAQLHLKTGKGNPFALFQTPGDRLGKAVAGAGDVDADGHEDFIAGCESAWIFSGGHGNKANLYSGADGDLLFVFEGDNKYDGFGMAVDAAGDLDADGTQDVVCGAPLDGTAFLSFHGSARAFSGADGTVIHLLEGDPDTSTFGNSLSGIGDLDLDGYPELIASGTGRFDGKPSVRLFSGVDGVAIASWTFEDEAGAEHCVADAVGDIDGDGFDDIAIGLRPDKPTVGKVRVISPHSVLGLPMPASIFHPGDTLSGELTGEKDSDQAQFLVLKDSLLNVLVEFPDPALLPEISLVRTKKGKLAQTVSKQVVSASGTSLSFVFPKTGTYALRIRRSNLSSVNGTYQVTTQLVPAPDGAPQSASVAATIPSKGDWVARSSFSAVAGTRLDTSILPASGLEPEHRILDPKNHVVSKALYSSSFDGTTLEIEGVPLLANGKYKLEIVADEKLAAFDVSLDPQVPSHPIVIEID